MPLRESEAIILQTYPLGEADRIISFLSRAMGRVRGVAAGARRPKSRFGAALERLSYVRLWFFERETRELVRINQCELLESFLEAFRDYDSSVALALLCEISEAVLPEREPSDACFRLLLLTARTIRRSGKPTLPVAYFCLWMAKLGGWLPPLDRCLRCGDEIGEERAFFSPGFTGLACAQCRLPGMHLLAGEALAAARRMLAERLERMDSSNVPETAAKELTHSMLDIIEHQAERKLASRALMEAQA